MALNSKILSPFSKILPSLCLPVLDFIFIFPTKKNPDNTHEGSLVLRRPKDLTFLQILKKNIGQYAIVWQHFIKRVPRHDLNLLKYILLQQRFGVISIELHI